MKNKRHLRSDAEFDVEIETDSRSSTDAGEPGSLIALDPQDSLLILPNTGWVETLEDTVVPTPENLNTIPSLQSPTPDLFVDEIDPDTGEVTSQRVSPEPVQQAEIADHMDTNSNSSGSSDPASDNTIVTPQPAPSEPLTDPENVMAEIVAYLLSPEGTELRRLTREAAYTARKTAYETATAEIKPQVLSLQARIHELDVASQQVFEGACSGEDIAKVEQAWEAAQVEVEKIRQKCQVAQDRLSQATRRVEQARLLSRNGRLPDLLLSGLESQHQAAEVAFAEIGSVFEQAKARLQEAATQRNKRQEDIQSEVARQMERYTNEKAHVEAEIQRLQAQLKLRQEEIAAASPEVILWKMVQVERARREAEITEKLVHLLPSQGIRKTLQDATRLGVPQNPVLVQAIEVRQARVSTQIDACRAQAERLADYPEVLPKDAYALLVRGDTIRVVDPEGHELEAHVACEQEGKFRTLSGQNGRRWKLNLGQDCFLVKQ